MSWASRRTRRAKRQWEILLDAAPYGKLKRMELAPFWIVDAFVGTWQGRTLRGNPAAVVLLSEFACDEELQERANEFHLAETAFVVPRGAGAFDLRWMTPLTEVNLCGHATLAAARALLDAGLLRDGETARFATRSGELSARVDGERVELDFPAQEVEECATPSSLRAALGLLSEPILFCGRAGEDWLLRIEPTSWKNLRPNLAKLGAIPARGIIVTSQPEAPAGETDFISRFFAPRVGIPEDPVTGSAHCALAPFWAARLGKQHLNAVQLSARGGALQLEVRGERVSIAGLCALRARGRLC